MLEEVARFQRKTWKLRRFALVFILSPFSICKTFVILMSSYIHSVSCTVNVTCIIDCPNLISLLGISLRTLRLSRIYKPPLFYVYLYFVPRNVCQLEERERLSPICSRRLIKKMCPFTTHFYETNDTFDIIPPTILQDRYLIKIHVPGL